MKLIIDTDPGIDDALAILYAAAHPDIELLGLTTVYGNVTIEQATRNALYLAERAGLDIPVAQGAAQPLSVPAYPPSHGVHGDEGFGLLPAPVPTQVACEGDAADFLIRMARQHPGELVICAIGPITNIALAIQRDPAFAGRLRRIVFMGGALDVPGNITPSAEANTFHDPHALAIVLDCGAPMLMVGLDVTMQVILTAGDFADLARIDRSHGAFLRDMASFYLEFYHAKGYPGCAFHDPLAVMACIDPAAVETSAIPVEVVLDGPAMGQTARKTGGRVIDVALGCDPDRIKSAYFKTMRSEGMMPAAG
ncbi:nucleoside hydrolase [Falsirhodobacter sp. alg1]|uniref:nucleoside hydrolase n=1 Tax=Falsirhodobacter sp. alg1 TaxID=1472418 RepID=UPI0005EFE523|nr:nucleoside hydrolase [Falsirhodobacter sp. alg1]